MTNGFVIHRRSSKYGSPLGDIQQLSECQDRRPTPASRPDLLQQACFSDFPEYPIRCSIGYARCLRQIRRPEYWPFEEPIERPHRVLRSGQFSNPIFLLSIELED